MPADQIRVFAVITAAGQSVRMGRPKQLLPLGGQTMLESVIETVLRGGIDGLCVVTSSAIDVELALCEDPRFLTAINDLAETQMLDSVLMGFQRLRAQCAVSDADAILVCPGDAAGVTASAVEACTSAYRLAPGTIIVATHNGRRGHPIVFPAALESDLRTIQDGGLKTLFARHPDRVREVPCGAGVLSDIDTPDDYAEVLRARNARDG